MSEKLKKCPWCGRIPKMWDEEDPYYPGGPVIVDHYLDCRCGVRMIGLGVTEEELIKRWNSRKYV